MSEELKKMILSKWKSKMTYPFNYGNFEELSELIEYLTQQLKQRDEVIDEAIKYINNKASKYERQETKNIFSIEYTLFLNDSEFVELENILQKYKGDNNE